MHNNAYERLDNSTQSTVENAYPAFDYERICIRYV